MKVTVVIEDDYGKKVTNEIIVNGESPLPDILRTMKGALHAIGFGYVDSLVINKDSGDDISSEDWE